MLISLSISFFNYLFSVLKKPIMKNSTVKRNFNLIRLWTVIAGLLVISTAWAVGSTQAIETTTQATNMDVFWLIFFISIALIVSFICSIAESVILSITPSFIADLKEKNPEKGAFVENVKKERIDQSLAAILTLNTMSHTLGSIGAGAKATIVFGDAWFGVFSALMTLAILALTEILPKSLGTKYWRQLAYGVSVYIKTIIFALYPLIWLSESFTKLIKGKEETHDFSRSEFAALASVGEASGQIDPLESRIIRNLLAFGAIKAEDIMTPRSVIVAVNQEQTIADLLAERPKLNFSRIPIYQEDLDGTTGFVLKTDLLLAQANNQLHQPVKNFQRDITFIFSKIKLFDLLDLMLKNRIHIALAVGEYGEVKGLVTLEDVLETLLGLEIVDEIDKVEDMQALARQIIDRRQARLGIHVEDKPEE